MQKSKDDYKEFQLSKDKKIDTPDKPEQTEEQIEDDQAFDDFTAKAEKTELKNVDVFVEEIE